MKWKPVRSGLAWIVFSPLALLMALLSTVKSDITYNVQIARFGTWAACGVISGIARIAGASWAMRLQMILCWIAFAAFAVPGVIMVGYAFKLIHTTGYVMFAVAVGVFFTGVPFLILARRLQRELRMQAPTQA